MGVQQVNRLQNMKLVYEKQGLSISNQVTEDTSHGGNMWSVSLHVHNLNYIKPCLT